MRKLLFIAATILLVTSAFAQQEIVLDNDTNSIDDTTLSAGRTHIINLRARDFDPRPQCALVTYNLNNGFVLYSPDGATWNHSVGNLTSPLLDASTWFTTGVNHYEDPVLGNGVAQGDGISPDYMVFFAASIPNLGLPLGFDDSAFTIEIATDLADSNLHICLDSSSLGKLNTWMWVSIPAIPCNVAPDWGGPYCFTIVASCCQEVVGNVDFDDAGIVDISDLTLLIDHLFINFPPLICDDEANIDGDIEGKVDISDLTVLIDHLFINFPPLPACQ